MTNRINFIDNSRAIGISLVVIGHLPGSPEALKTLIYGFHMPLFFLISGYLLSFRRLQQGWQVHLQEQYRKLVVPYLLFFLLSWLWWYMSLSVRHMPPNPEEITRSIMGLLTGRSIELQVNVVLWFFPCLLCCSTLYFAARRLLSSGYTLLLALLSALLLIEFSMRETPLFLNLDTALVAVFFYAFGQWLLQNQDRKKGLNYWLHPRWLLLWLPLYIVLSLFNGRCDMQSQEWGRYPALYLPVAIIGCIACLGLARAIPLTSIAKWLSKNTMFVFPLHPLFFSLFTGFAILIFHIPESSKENSLILNIVYMLGALLLSWPASILLRKIFPSIFANRHHLKSAAKHAC